MVCSVCAKQKADLHPKKSRLHAATTLFLCGDCIKAKREPRYLIILVGRANGWNAVADYVKNRRYVGETIPAEDLIV